MLLSLSVLSLCAHLPYHNSYCLSPTVNSSPLSIPQSISSPHLVFTPRQHSSRLKLAIFACSLDEKFDMTLPAPSRMTDAQYWSAVSPSNDSTLTQGNLDATAMSRPSPPTSRPASLLSPPRTSSSLSSLLQSSSSRPPSSSESLIWPPHPLSPTQSEQDVRVPAPPLRPVHFNCYQSHRRMLPSPNAYHPLPCMTCGVENKNVRWRCVWCCLRICTGCMDSLNKDRERKLAVLVENVERKAQSVDGFHCSDSATLSGSLRSEASRDEEGLENRH